MSQRGIVSKVKSDIAYLDHSIEEHERRIRDYKYLIEETKAGSAKESIPALEKKIAEREELASKDYVKMMKKQIQLLNIESKLESKR